MKKIIPILVVVVLAAGALVGAAVFILPSELPMETAQSLPTAAVPTARPAEVTVRPTPSPTPEPTPEPEATPTPTPPPPELPTPTPKIEYPVANTPVLDDSETDKGVISLRYSSDKRIMVLIKKGGKESKNYLSGNNQPERYPLSMGTGEYTVDVLENRAEGRYAHIASFQVSGHWDDPTIPYLQSVRRIHWDPSMQPIYDALLIELELEEGALDEIYRELSDTLMYDWSVLNKLPAGYVPDIQDIYDTRLGICQDFSALFAAMLRSIDIPAKMVSGYCTEVDGRHAWNEVYVDGTWVTYDLTFDAILREGGDPNYNEKRDGSKYTHVDEY